MTPMTPRQLAYVKEHYADVLKQMNIYDCPDLNEYIAIQEVDGKPELMLNQKGFIQAARYAPDQEGAARLVTQAIRVASSQNGLLDIPYNLRCNPFTFIKANVTKSPV